MDLAVIIVGLTYKYPLWNVTGIWISPGARDMKFCCSRKWRREPDEWKRSDNLLAACRDLNWKEYVCAVLGAAQCGQASRMRHEASISAKVDMILYCPWYLGRLSSFHDSWKQQRCKNDTVSEVI